MTSFGIMNYFKFFHSPPLNVPARARLWFRKLFLCKFTQVLDFDGLFAFEKNYKKKLTTLRLVNIWSWWFFLYKQIQGSEKCVFRSFLGNRRHEKWTWRKEKHEKIFFVFHHEVVGWPQVETNKMWPQVVFTHKKNVLREGRKKKIREQRKNTMNPIRAIAQKKTHRSAKKCQTKSTKRESEWNVSIFLIFNLRRKF